MIVPAGARLRRRFLGAVVTTALLVVGVVSTASPAMASSEQAADGATAVVTSGPVSVVHELDPDITVRIGDIVYDCSWVTCSAYYSRSATRNLDAIASHSELVAGVCALLGKAHPIATGVCGSVVADYASSVEDAIEDAAGSNGCLRLRFTRTLPLVIVGAYADGGGHCKD